MDSKEYYQKVMREFEQNRKGRSLRTYCKEEGIDYNWVVECKRNYPKETTKQAESPKADFLPLEITEEEPKTKTWAVENLTIKTPDGEFIEIKTNSLTVASALLGKIAQP